MRVEFINPFISATLNVFNTMLGCQLTRGSLTLAKGGTPEYDVSGVIGLAGKARGVVVVSFGRSTAIRATERMLMSPVEHFNKDVIDAVGEIANMVAGAAKAELDAYQLSVGLPSVICGKYHMINFPTDAKPISIPFQSEIGPACIQVGLVESPSPVCV